MNTLYSRSDLALEDTGNQQGVEDFTVLHSGGRATLEATGTAGARDLTGPDPHTTVPRRNLDRKEETALVEYILVLCYPFVRLGWTRRKKNRLTML